MSTPDPETPASNDLAEVIGDTWGEIRVGGREDSDEEHASRDAGAVASIYQGYSDPEHLTELLQSALEAHAGARKPYLNHYSAADGTLGWTSARVQDPEFGIESLLPKFASSDDRSESKGVVVRIRSFLSADPYDPPPVDFPEHVDVAWKQLQKSGISPHFEPWMKELLEDRRLLRSFLLICMGSFHPERFASYPPTQPWMGESLGSRASVFDENFRAKLKQQVSPLSSSGSDVQSVLTKILETKAKQQKIEEDYENLIPVWRKWEFPMFCWGLPVEACRALETVAVQEATEDGNGLQLSFTEIVSKPEVIEAWDRWQRRFPNYREGSDFSIFGGQSSHSTTESSRRSSRETAASTTDLSDFSVPTLDFLQDSSSSVAGLGDARVGSDSLNPHTSYFSNFMAPVSPVLAGLGDSLDQHGISATCVSHSGGSLHGPTPEEDGPMDVQKAEEFLLPARFFDSAPLTTQSSGAGMPLQESSLQSGLAGSDGGVLEHGAYGIGVFSSSIGRSASHQEQLDHENATSAVTDSQDAVILEQNLLCSGPGGTESNIAGGGSVLRREYSNLLQPETEHFSASEEKSPMGHTQYYPASFLTASLKPEDPGVWGSESLRYRPRARVVDGQPQTTSSSRLSPEAKPFALPTTGPRKQQEPEKPPPVTLAARLAMLSTASSGDAAGSRVVGGNGGVVDRSRNREVKQDGKRRTAGTEGLRGGSGDGGSGDGGSGGLERKESDGRGREVEGVAGSGGRDGDAPSGGVWNKTGAQGRGWLGMYGGNDREGGRGGRYAGGGGGRVQEQKQQPLVKVDPNPNNPDRPIITIIRQKPSSGSGNVRHMQQQQYLPQPHLKMQLGGKQGAGGRNRAPVGNKRFGPGQCYRCGSFGHKQYNCPKSNSRQ